MKKGKQRIPELSEEQAAQILRNVFAACKVPENQTPFPELLRRSREHMGRRRQDQIV